MPWGRRGHCARGTGTVPPMPGDLALLGRVATGFVLAFVVGFERELRGSPAGDRTFALVGTGTTALTAVALKTSPQAVAGAITGIGFIGAGVVFHGQGELVRGLTSAAAIFAIAPSASSSAVAASGWAPRPPSSCCSRSSFGTFHGFSGPTPGGTRVGSAPTPTRPTCHPLRAPHRNASSAMSKAVLVRPSQVVGESFHRLAPVRAN